MPPDRYLVTGAMGCLGSWIIRRLLDDDAAVIAYDRSSDDHRLRLIMDDREMARIGFVTGDLTDGVDIAGVIRDQEITHVIHCAALQVPFVRADPAAGARVNVLGTVNVFEAVRQARDTVRSLVYASSAAVYGPPDLYPGGIDDASPLRPFGTLYGVFKQANEGTARLYANEHRLGSIGLRPFVIYGPGRDQGMTSTPTEAIVAALVGRRYRISFSGPIYATFVRDAADAFIAASRAVDDEAVILNLPGETVDITAFIRAIEHAVPEAVGLITAAPDTLASPSAVDASSTNRVLVTPPITPFEEAVGITAEVLRIGVVRDLVRVPG